MISLFSQKVENHHHGLKRRLDDEQVCAEPSNPYRKRLRVQFAEHKNTVQSRHVSEDDLRCLWLQKHDYEVIRSKIRSTLSTLKFSNGDLSKLDTTEECLRGLEMPILFHVYKIKSNQRDFTRNVCSFFKVQRHMGLHDPESLQMLASTLSKADRNRAAEIATLIDVHTLQS